MRWYIDEDTDGWGGFDHEYYCPGDTPTLSEYDHVTRSGDCEDTIKEVNPDAQELCSNEWDDDCDSKIDEYGKIGPDDPNALYYASDGDCRPIATSCCPKGLTCVSRAEDVCAGTLTPTPVPVTSTPGDNSPTSTPEASTAETPTPEPVTDTLAMETPTNTTPESGTETPTPSTAVSPNEEATPAIDHDEDNFSIVDGDCDDSEPFTYPGAEEFCDGMDNNCDGSTDEGATIKFYRDEDLDGFGVAGVFTMACAPPFGYSAKVGDCNDISTAIHPGAIEKCEIEVKDQDCDGVDDEGFVDMDGDGTCLEWIYLLPYSFAMGSHPEETGSDRDEGLHIVQLTHGFFILDTEMTVGMYNRLMNSDRTPNAAECTDTTDDNTCPINRVSWTDTLKVANALTAACNASTRCKTLSSSVNSMSSAYNISDFTWIDPDGIGPKTGYDQTGYRLPTEAEWEYAVRAGMPFDWTAVTLAYTAFYQGGIDQPSSCSAGGDTVMREIGWFSCNAPVCGSTPCASQVARDPLSGGNRSFPETELGLYDMSGNLYEWVWDLYLTYPATGITIDPAQDASSGARVIRGGSYLSTAEDCRSANRASEERTSGGRADLGFRLVRSAIPDPVP